MKLKLILFLLPLGLLAQQPPACTPSSTSNWKGAFTTAAAGTSNANNTANPNCNAFALTWTSPTTGITALSIQLEGSDDNSTFTAFTGTTTVLVGTNPSTSLSGAIVIQASSHLAYIRARVNSISGSGVVNYQIYGYNGVTPAARAGGGGGTVTAVTATAPLTSSGGTAPNISASYHGTSPHIQLSDNTGASGNLASYDSAGNVTDASIASTNVMQIQINNVGTSAFGLDMSGSTRSNAVRFPVVAGATATLNGVIDYDSTSNNLHAGHSSADSIVPVTTVTPANGNCANWSVSGGSLKLGDAGSACGSGSGGGGGVVTYSGPTLSVLSGTSFVPIGGGGAASATETNVDIDSSAAATVSKMYVQLSQALGVGNSVAVTWRDNATSKAVTCTISGASATACNDTTHSFNVANGDLLDYQLVFTGTIIVTPTILIMSAFGTSNVGVTSVFGNTGPTVGAVGDIGATGQVVGLEGVPFCTGFTPTTGQNLQYTTASSPNPCYTAAAAASGGTNATFGLFSALPGTCAHSSTASDLYFTTDSYYTFLCTATNTFSPFMDGKQVTRPTAASTWTLVNGTSGTAAKSDSHGAVVISTTASVLAGETILKAIPAIPYTKTIALRAFANGGSVSSANVGCGMVVTSGTANSNAIQYVAINPGNTTFGTSVSILHYANYSYGSGVADVNSSYNIGSSSSANIWFQVADNGTNRSWSVSVDGETFVKLFTSASASPFTPTNYGVGCFMQSAGAGVPWAISILSDI